MIESDDEKTPRKAKTKKANLEKTPKGKTNQKTPKKSPKKGKIERK